MNSPSPIQAMIARIDSSRSTTPPPTEAPNLARLVRTVALLNIPPAVCAAIAGALAFTGNGAWPFFLVACVLMVCWVKTIQVPHN
jgi:hypothetical protein